MWLDDRVATLSKVGFSPPPIVSSSMVCLCLLSSGRNLDLMAHGPIIQVLIVLSSYFWFGAPNTQCDCFALPQGPGIMQRNETLGFCARLYISVKLKQVPIRYRQYTNNLEECFRSKFEQRFQELAALLKKTKVGK